MMLGPLVIVVSMSIANSTAQANGIKDTEIEGFLGSLPAEVKLLASNAQQGDEFGFSVSLDGGRAVVGAPEENGGDGSAYVFDRDGLQWNQVRLLVAPERSRERFGWSVSHSNGRILVGAPEYTENFIDLISEEGAAYLFESFGAPQMLIPAVPDNLGNFGMQVLIDGNRAFILSRAGIHHFELDGATWVETGIFGGGFSDFDVSGDAIIQGNRVYDLVTGFWETLTLPEGNFPYVVTSAIDGQRAVLTIAELNVAGSRVFVYQREGSVWNLEQELVATTNHSEPQLGNFLDIECNQVLVSANDDDGAPDSGAVFQFQRLGGFWQETAKLKPDLPQAGSFYQLHQTSGGRAIVGNFADNEIGTDAGAAFIETLRSAPDCFEPDDEPESGTLIMVGGQGQDRFPQSHSLHTPEEVDWFKFVGQAGGGYYITAKPGSPELPLRVSVFNELGEAVRSNGCQPINPVGQSVGVSLSPESNTLFDFSVSECNPGEAGEPRTYEVDVSFGIHPDCVVLEGKLTRSGTTVPVPFAWVLSDVNNTAISGPDGNYIICADYDVQVLTLIPQSGDLLPRTINVLENAECSPECLEPHPDFVGPERQRIEPGTRTTLDVSLFSDVILKTGFEQGEE